MLDMVAGDFVPLPVQVHTYRATAAVGKATLLDDTILGTAQANQRVGFIEHIPVVL